jgi:hypothetical protein
LAIRFRPFTEMKAEVEAMTDAEIEAACEPVMGRATMHWLAKQIGALPDSAPGADDLSCLSCHEAFVGMPVEVVMPEGPGFCLAGGLCAKCSALSEDDKRRAVGMTAAEFVKQALKGREGMH